VPLPLQTPGPAAQLTKEFAIKGGIKLLLDEVVIPVRAILDRPRKFAMGFANVAAGGAGLRTEVVLVNTFFPQLDQDGSVLIHKVWFNSGVSTAFELAVPTAALSGFADIATERFLDLARSGSPQAAFQEDNAAAASAATVFTRYAEPTVGTTRLITFEQPIILDHAPGVNNAVILRGNQDNANLQCTILWSEPADPA